MINKFDFKVIDLTHTLSSEIPTWDEGCGFELSVNTDYTDCVAPDLFKTQQVNMKAGVGTHIDAPAHCFQGRKTVDELEMGELATEGVMIDVSAELSEDYIITPEVLVKFEKENGVIKPGTFVILYTGWSKYWGDKQHYINNHKFPSLHADAAQLLIERSIVGLGIDTLSADTGTKGFPVHRIVLGAGKYLVENIANADSLPSTGFKILVLPMKIKDATEAPLRLIALV